MTPNGPRGWWNDIDPTALIDENGQAWLSWETELVSLPS